MHNAPKSNTIATGLAMFSMFFGAGNVVFPLAVGQYAQDTNFFAILGLLITAVGVPFLGLMSMTLFHGNYQKFFQRIGTVPGFVVAFLIMGLIGPFGAIPRCITLSFSTIQMFFPEVTLIPFVIVACLLIFLFTFRRNNIIDVLGYVLTPFLLISLLIIIIKGLYDAESMLMLEKNPFETFWHGLKEGYQTMDLMGAFFFSSVILVCLKKELPSSEEHNYRKLLKMTSKASLIGASLLGAVYIGFSYLAAFNGNLIANAPTDQMLGVIALHVLGPYAGVVACIGVALACLTTAIALAAVFAEFIYEDISQKKLSYVPSLVITLIVTAFMSTLNFKGIAAFLLPILIICYPALIVLSIMNILNKIYHVKWVKTPVFITFCLSLIAYFL